MKNIILMMMVLASALVASAEEFTYLKFTTASGTEKTLEADGLVITFADGNAVAVSGETTATFSLSALASMEFTNEAAGDDEPTYHVYDVNHDGSVNVGDVNQVLNTILSETYVAVDDVNSDESVNVGDVNAILNYILSQSEDSEGDGTESAE